MRIAFDAKRYFNNQTGLGNYSRSIVHALVKKYPQHEFILMHNKAELPLKNAKNLITFSPKYAGKLWRNFGIAKDLKELNIDVYHGLSNEIPAGLLNSGIRTVCTIHDVIFKRYPENYRFFDRQIYHWKTKYALKHADTIIATSGATKQDILRYYPATQKPIEVIYQPVKEAFYEQKKLNNTNEKYFIYVSSFTQRKNHGTLIQAFARIQKIVEQNLFLAGMAGETLASVKQFIESEKLQNRIKIFENPSDEKIIELLQNADGFVYPSFFEGFGIPLAEAAAAGIPAAVSDIAVFRELAGDSAIYFHPNKFEEIADAMLQLTNPDLKVKQLQKMHIILDKIDENKIATQLMEIYRGS